MSGRFFAVPNKPPVQIPSTRWNVPPDIVRARNNWARFLLTAGSTLTVKRAAVDSDGLSTGEGTIVVLSGVPFCENLGGTNAPPVTMSGAGGRRGDIYEPYPVSLSMPHDTHILKGDRLEQEPTGSGLPVYEVNWVDDADPLRFDLQVNANVIRPSRGASG